MVCLVESPRCLSADGAVHMQLMKESAWTHLVLHMLRNASHFDDVRCHILPLVPTGLPSPLPIWNSSNIHELPHHAPVNPFVG
ncbi:unnamed protein product, partial [Staurois parvus]